MIPQESVICPCHFHHNSVLPVNELSSWRKNWLANWIPYCLSPVCHFRWPSNVHPHDLRRSSITRLSQQEKVHSTREITAKVHMQTHWNCVKSIFQNKIWKLLPQETIKEEKAAILDASESDRESNTDTSESGKFPSYPLLVGPDPARSGNAKNHNVAKPFPSDDTLACSRLVKLNAWNLTPVFHPTLSSDLNQIFESYS